MTHHIETVYKKFYKDLQKYIFSNNVVITASGFAIGMATKEVITKIISILIVPIFEHLRRLSQVKILWRYSIFSIPFEIFWTILLWIVTIIFTFLFLEYFLNKTIFGMVSTIKENDEKTFIKSKVEAKAISIIPSSEDSYMKQLKVQEKKIDEIVSRTKEEKIPNVDKLIHNEMVDLFEKYYQ
jgi:hypothetical protein